MTYGLLLDQLVLSLHFVMVAHIHAILYIFSWTFKLRNISVLKLDYKNDYTNNVYKNRSSEVKSSSNISILMIHFL